jgi:predicted phage terminase large subunit-like protein
MTSAELNRRSFRKFTREAWHVVEPATPLQNNWHVDAICDHLEAVARGQIRKLLINIPPGHAKSLLVAVLWPAWVWTWRPDWRSLWGSYAGDLALRDSVKCRTLVESEWYVDRFRRDWTHGGLETWRLSSDQDTKTVFENTRSGFRMALGVGGKGTGFRGNCVGVDDPLNAREAFSKIIRDSTAEWWDKTMSTRVNDPQRDSFVMVMQRLHDDDTSAHVLEQGGYVHLCLPSEFEPERRCRTTWAGHTFEDPRQKEGDLLFPARFPRPVLEEAKTVLGDDYDGQHQQRPNPEGGGMFKKEWWRFFRYDTDAPAHFERPKGCNEIPTRVIISLGWRWDAVVISLDCSFKSVTEAKTKGKGPDHVSFTVWGTRGADRFLLYRFNKPIGFTETLEQFREVCKLFPRAYKKLVEDKANGPAVINSLTHEISGIIPITPEGGKESRANAIAPQVKAGNVYIWEGLGTLSVAQYVGEFASFPRGRHDDDVDSTSQALNDIGQSGANRTRMLTSRAAL